MACNKKFDCFTAVFCWFLLCAKYVLYDDVGMVNDYCLNQTEGLLRMYDVYYGCNEGDVVYGMPLYMDYGRD